MKLFFKKFGIGSPLIILHGLFGSYDNWQGMAKKFADNFEIYLIDLRNHGQSPHSDIHDYNAMSQDLYEFFIENNLNKAIILGHSMGGKVAMKFAFEYPDMVEKLIVVDIAPKEYRTGNKYILEFLLDIDLKNINSREKADEILANKINNKAVRQFILKNLIRNEDMSFSWKLNLKSLNENLHAMGGNFNGDNNFNKKTLFIRGENSNYIRENDFTLIKKIFTDSEIKTVKNAGHWVHTENPEKTYEYLRDFLL
ncbi:MAG: alpha/beta fold hydrolase [Candidatus Sericytochromatia bacterium]